MSEREPCRLFDWLPLLALAAGRKLMPAPRVSVAMFIALSAKGQTGEGATIDVDRLTLELDVSARQVWRHVEALVDDGWIEQTQRPTRATKGKPGRRARYRLTAPTLNLSHESARAVCHDDTGERHTNPPTDRVTPAPVDTSHDGPADPVDNPNRVTFPDESCAIATPDDGTLPPIHRSPTRGTTPVTTGPAASARDQLAAARRRRQAGT